MRHVKTFTVCKPCCLLVRTETKHYLFDNLKRTSKPKIDFFLHKTGTLSHAFTRNIARQILPNILSQVILSSVALGTIFYRTQLKILSPKQKVSHQCTNSVARHSVLHLCRPPSEKVSPIVILGQNRVCSWISLV